MTIIRSFVLFMALACAPAYVGAAQKGTETATVEGPTNQSWRDWLPSLNLTQAAQKVRGLVSTPTDALRGAHTFVTSLPQTVKETSRTNRQLRSTLKTFNREVTDVSSAVQDTIKRVDQLLVLLEFPIKLFLTFLVLYSIQGIISIVFPVFKMLYKTTLAVLLWVFSLGSKAESPPKEGGAVADLPSDEEVVTAHTLAGARSKKKPGKTPWLLCSCLIGSVSLLVCACYWTFHIKPAEGLGKHQLHIIT